MRAGGSVARLRPLLLAAALASGLAAAASPATASSGRLAQALADFRMGEYDSAARVIEPLARAGDPEAQFWLGTLHYQGRGKPRLFREALAWYRLAAEGGNADAQNNLGLMHRNGEGVEASPLLAYAWFTLSAGQGSTIARDNLDALSATLTPGQILQGQQLAQEALDRIGRARRRPAAPVQAGPPLDDVYMVQVGLFQNADNVRRIRDALRREKLPLLDDGVEIRGAAYRRLRVGPFPDSAAARTTARRVDSLLGVESAVIPVPRRN